MSETAYEDLSYRASELSHQYGEGVTILGTPYLLSLLARLCSPETRQPAVNRLMEQCYRGLLERVFSAELPRQLVDSETRMIASTPKGRYRGEVIDRSSRVVTVNIARAGTLPSHCCYEMLNELLDADNVRQDHLIMNRATDETDRVIGATLNGSKVGGDVDGRFLIVPDPMGATGSSMLLALDHYQEHVAGTPSAVIHVHLIITPEYIRAIRARYPSVKIYAIRLDRGTSPDTVFKLPLGHDVAETGLNEVQYIVPGGGGFGEVLNNAEV